MGKKPENWHEKQVFTTGEAAEICNVSQQTIIRCFDSGRLRGFRVPGSRSRRIPRDELREFMKANSMPTGALESDRKRVLVVDRDSQAVVRFINALSLDERFEVKSAATGYDAGILTEQFRPHLVLLDSTLPDADGSLVCQRIKKNPELPDTLVIVTSDRATGAEVERLRECGADEFFRKPINVDILIARMAELLRA